MKRVLFLSLVVGMLFSCSSTHLITSWKAPDASAHKFSKVLVGAVMGGQYIELRANVENALVQSLKAKGVNAFSSYELYGPKAFEGMSQKDAAAKIEQDGFDGAFTVVLLDRTKERNYVPGNLYYSPYYMGYGRYWSHYYMMYDRVYTPGYYTTSTNYILEANFYNLIGDGDALEYSAQTQSFDPSSIQRLAQEFSKTVVDDMMAKGLLSN
jgi:hypothetical protein